MKVDVTTKEVLLEIEKELKEKGINISIQEIGSVVESQFIAGKLAFKKGLEVRLPVFGTFVRKHGVEKGIAAAKLNEFKDVFDKETFDRKVLEAKLKNKEVTRKRKKEMKVITITDLSNTKNYTDSLNKFDKIL